MTLYTSLCMQDAAVLLPLLPIWCGHCWNPACITETMKVGTSNYSNVECIEIKALFCVYFQTNNQTNNFWSIIQSHLPKYHPWAPKDPWPHHTVAESLIQYQMYIFNKGRYNKISWQHSHIWNYSRNYQFYIRCRSDALCSIFKLFLCAMAFGLPKVKIMVKANFDGHDWGPTFNRYVSCFLAIRQLQYSKLHIWPWKYKAKIMVK